MSAVRSDGLKTPNIDWRNSQSTSLDSLKTQHLSTLTLALVASPKLSREALLVKLVR